MREPKMLLWTIEMPTQQPPRQARLSDVFEARSARADLPREIWQVIRFAGGIVDMGGLLQFVKWDRRIEVAAIVQHFVGTAVEQDPPVKTGSSAGERTDQAHKMKNDRRAIASECVVPFGMIAQLICLLNVFEEKLAGPLRSGGRAVKVDLFARAKIGAQANDVTFIAEQVNQLVFSKESEDRGVSDTDLFARLYRSGNVLIPAKPEADDRMRDVG